MPAPSPLAIATSAVQRLVKEEKSYEKELAQQGERVSKLEAQIKDGSAPAGSNAEYMLKQEQKAMDETKAVFLPLGERIEQAVQRLEEQIATAESENEGKGGTADDELEKAREVLKLGQAVRLPGQV
ncbi:tubulin binding cofactor A [Xylariomycetidae sp. FL2044]|nr:tubulin binding cofactor A [Xylariomycetidae sp. FL2044]